MSLSVRVRITSVASKRNWRVKRGMWFGNEPIILTEFFLILIQINC